MAPSTTERMLLLSTDCAHCAAPAVRIDSVGWMHAELDDQRRLLGLSLSCQDSHTLAAPGAAPVVHRSLKLAPGRDLADVLGPALYQTLPTHVLMDMREGEPMLGVVIALAATVVVVVMALAVFALLP